MSSRYLLTNPVINKESYFATDKIRSAYIPVNGQPTILNETPQNILDYVFDSLDSLYSIQINPYFFYTLSLNHTLSERVINKTATHIYRIHTSYYNRVIYGDVLVFGSVDPLDPYSRETYHSLPYEVMEQLFLYNKSLSKE